MAEEFGDGEFGSGVFGGNAGYLTPEPPGTIDNAPSDDTDDDVPIDEEQELVDLRVERNDIQLSPTGDLDMVRGIDNVKQSAALDVRDIVHFDVGNQLTANNVFDVKAAIQRSLSNDPQLNGPVTVEVESVAPEANRIDFHVITHDNEEFSLDVVLPQ